MLRVIGETLDGDGNTTHFTFIIEEWEYHDGPHGATETINWLAVEEGVHTLPDGRIIEAGTTLADESNTGVTLEGDFDDPPVVLTSVMSENDTTTVDSDPLGISATGFNVRLQEEEGEDGNHANETVGWIAIQAGGDAASGTADTFGGVDENTDVLSLGDTFTNGVVLAETQTINGGDTATVVIDGQTDNTVGVFIEEEQSGDNETNHIDETVGIVAFESGLILCFTKGTHIRTPSGEQPVERLATGDLVTLHQGPRADTDMQAPVMRIFRRDLDKAALRANPKLYPVRIMAGALGGGLPKRDLLVSPQHRMLVSSRIAERMFGSAEVLIPAIKLTDCPGIFVDDTVAAVSYFHLLLEKHAVIFAEDAPTETLYTGKEALKTLSEDARTEILSIFPELSDDRHVPSHARAVPPNQRAKHLVKRHLKNAKPLLEGFDTALK